MHDFLISYDVCYRVPTVDEALELREKLSNLPTAKLESFSYKEKTTKSKDFIDEYLLVKAKLVVNNEKEPTSKMDLQLVKRETLIGGTESGELLF